MPWLPRPRPRCKQATQLDLVCLAQVALWHRPAMGKSPTPRTFDFTTLPNAAGVIKNDSTQGPYNTWTDGSGGVCADVWKGHSYCESY
jgi:hypothetical protein